MSTWTEKLTEIQLPHVAVFARYRDGEHKGYRLYAEDGYVMHDTSDVMEPMEDGTMPEIYYCREVYVPLNYDFDNCPWVAVIENQL